MNAIIENICGELNDFAQQLKKEAGTQIKSLLPNTAVMPITAPQPRRQSSVSNPERPWTIGGGAALATGAIGIIFSGAAGWYVLAGAGVAAMLYGQTKKTSSSKTDEASRPMQTHGLKGYEIADKVIALAKTLEDKWRNKVEECKSKVQHAIESSAVSVEAKDSLISQTYSTERLNIDFEDTVNQLNTASSSNFSAILSKFESRVNNTISQVANEQISIYRKISQNL